MSRLCNWRHDAVCAERSNETEKAAACGKERGGGGMRSLISSVREAERTAAATGIRINEPHQLPRPLLPQPDSASLIIVPN